MPTPILLKQYHQNEPKSQELYHSLYNSVLAHHIDIPIKHLNASHEFTSFYYYTEDIMQILSSIMLELRQLTSITATLPHIAIESFRRACLIEEIQSSNAIEGVRSTRKEIKTAIDEQDSTDSHHRPRLWSTVNKYLKLQQQEEISFRCSHDLRKFYDEFLADEIKRDDPTNLPDGKIFRKEPVDVWSKSKVIHRGIIPEEKIILSMETALKTLQNEQIPGLIRISIFHYFFGYIHPFYDGNGRTSRFITSYYLAKILHPLVAIRLSITIKKSLRVYYKLFEDTNHPGNYGDLTPFITGFLWLIQKSTTRVNEILQERRKKLDALAQALEIHYFGTAKNKADWKIYFILLQAYLFSDDGATLKEIASTVGQSAKTIQTHIKRYPADHITTNTTRRAHRYKLSTDFIKKLETLASK